VRCVFLISILLLNLILSCSEGIKVDVVIENGIIYDGTGNSPFKGSVAIKGEKIVYVGSPKSFQAKKRIDATDQAVSPGFINMLSWGVETLIEDGKSQSDIRQGVTLEVFGEGMSWGPLNEQMKVDLLKKQGDIQYEIPWNTLGEYLQFLEEKGVSTNIASFIGATTLRINAVGYEDREPNTKELKLMTDLVHQGMKEGALGIGSSLIYAPAFYSSTKELIEICKIAAQYDGMYISHMRSEGNKILESVDELLTIAKEAGIRSEIYHLKQSGKKNWGKLDAVIQKIDSARTAARNNNRHVQLYCWRNWPGRLYASLGPRRWS